MCVHLFALVTPPSHYRLGLDSTSSSSGVWYRLVWRFPPPTPTPSHYSLGLDSTSSSSGVWYRLVWRSPPPPPPSHYRLGLDSTSSSSGVWYRLVWRFRSCFCRNVAPQALQMNGFSPEMYIFQIKCLYNFTVDLTVLSYNIHIRPK